MVDVETDGPIPGDYSMISFGAVIVETGLERTFYGRLRPISDKWKPEALAISGHTREETLEFDDPAIIMASFEKWLQENAGDRPQFVSDNAGFDWMWVCWYFHHFLQRNPFGYSSTSLTSLYKGMESDMFASFRHLKKTPHTHHPVDDAKGNAEALLAMKDAGLKIKLSSAGRPKPS
jgi:hypothetical protein